jgi:hypothetical protein
MDYIYEIQYQYASDYSWHILNTTKELPEAITAAQQLSHSNATIGKVRVVKVTRNIEWEDR